MYKKLKWYEIHYAMRCPYEGEYYVYTERHKATSKSEALLKSVNDQYQEFRVVEVRRVNND